MGQYYKALLIREGEKPYVFDSWATNNGAKLMEHSYIGNTFVNQAMTVLAESPARVAWVGDYSDSWNELGYELGGGFVKNKRDYQKYYRKCWGERAKNSEPVTDKFKDKYIEDYIQEPWYLCNLTKREYIDLAEYCEVNIYHLPWSEPDPWCVNPLPLMTAVGNNQGGGDFYDRNGNIGYDNVGTWAFDELYLTREKPEDMLERDIEFKEGC